MTPPLRHSQNQLSPHEYPWHLVTLSKCGSRARRTKINPDMTIVVSMFQGRNRLLGCVKKLNSILCSWIKCLQHTLLPSSGIQVACSTKFHWSAYEVKICRPLRQQRPFGNWYWLPIVSFWPYFVVGIYRHQWFSDFASMPILITRYPNV